MNKKVNVLFAGPLPPPVGGISIHIWRLKFILEKEFNLDFIDEAREFKSEYFNIRSFNIIKYFQKIALAELFFIHSGNKLFKKIHILSGKLFGKKILLTLHGYGPRRKMPFSAIDAFFFNLADRIILVNDDIINRVSLPINKCVVRHAFLPPIMTDESALPPLVTQAIQNARSTNSTVICANASQLKRHKNEDLYGLDMCIEVANRLVKQGLSVYFIFTVSTLEKGIDIFEKGIQLIANYQLENHFLLVNEKLSFVRLIENADIVVRPTNMDGDALTIREALYLNTPVIASDVITRPSGTILFKTRDINDFEMKLLSTIQQQTRNKKKISNHNLEREDLDGFYSDLINSIVK